MNAGSSSWALFAISLLSSLSSTEAACISGPFFLEVEDVAHCGYRKVLAAFETMIAGIPACAGLDAENELVSVLGVPDIRAAKSVLNGSCESAWRAYLADLDTVEFSNIARNGEEFVKEFFNGKTDWNELVQTDYPLTDNGKPSFKLDRQARLVERFFEGDAAFSKVNWPPSSVPNFDSCASNTVYCCWPTDRQAGDGNGNCKKPYDSDCVDKDPADNTNLCYVDVQSGSDTIGRSGMQATLSFDGDDDNGDHTAEGPIHCHGFAWADPTQFPLDPSYHFRGNNLFYVSMYDHLYDRGYARNIPGAPMCACAEQMPVVSRSDCTQIDLIVNFRVEFNGGAVNTELGMVELEFNSCQGIDRYGEADDNDLWSYAHELFLEGKMTDVQLKALTKRLVGDEPDACMSATKQHFGQQLGHVRGLTYDPNKWTKVAGREAFAYTSSLGATAMSDFIMGSSHQILVRTCPDCVPTHREIFYKRLTEGNGLHIVDHLKYSKQEIAGGIYGTDFLLYSTLEDAIAGTNEWACVEYKYNKGFPGRCNPEGGITRNQESLFHRMDGQRTDVAFFVYNPTSLSASIALTSVGSKSMTGMAIDKVVGGVNRFIIAGFGEFNVGEEIDSFDFHQIRKSGDFEIVAKLEAWYYINNNSRTGLMIRSGLGSDAAHFAICINGKNKVDAHFRETTGDESQKKSRDTMDVPIWMKIAKSGSTYMAYTKLNDTAEWVLKRSVTLNLDEQNLRAGIFISSNQLMATAEAQYSNISL